MHSQLMLTSAKLEIADRERHAARSRHALDREGMPVRRAGRLLASLCRPSVARSRPNREGSLRVDQNPSV